MLGKKSVGWLLPVPRCTLDIAKTSNLASVRIRIALSCQKFIDNGFEIELSDGNFKYTPNFIYIGKFNYTSDSTRLDRWISAIKGHKNKGAKIILDYTDNHIISESESGAFYKQAISLADKVICSSDKLALHLSKLGSQNISIIEDPIEYSFIKPNGKNNITKRALWFGHSSNIQYLLNFLISLKNYSKKFEIICLTNAYPISDEIIEKLNKLLPKNIEVKFIEWSHENMIEAANISDFCIIPAGFMDPKKDGASSNRLLTALTLGLPTLADPLFSYLPYNKFFDELNLDNLSKIIENPIEQYFKKVMLGQAMIMSKYTKEVISEKWLSQINSFN